MVGMRAETNLAAIATAIIANSRAVFFVSSRVNTRRPRDDLPFAVCREPFFVPTPLNSERLEGPPFFSSRAEGHE